MKRYNLDTRYIWPVSLNYTLQGNEYSATYSYIEITVNRCNGLKWRTQNEINNAIADNKLELVIVNTYFDNEDFNTPVKTYLDNRMVLKYWPGYAKFTTLYAQQRTSSRIDSYFDFLDNGSSDNFVGVDQITQDFDTQSTNNNNAYFKIYVRLDPKQILYSRQVYSFLAFTGDLGGVFQILIIVGGFIVGMFAEKSF